ncbi:MAG: hypothetical protein ACOCQ4_02260, partial [bacterium]
MSSINRITDINTEATNLSQENNEIESREFIITYWNDISGFNKFESNRNWPKFIDELKNVSEQSEKKQCPLIKCAKFGEKKTEKGSLRHDNNVEELYVIEGDIDNGKISIEDAKQSLENENIKAVIFTTWSHKIEYPRLRVYCLLSKPIKPKNLNKYVSRLNEALNYNLADESFKISQSYYIGKNPNSEYRFEITFDDPYKGKCIDNIFFYDEPYDCDHKGSSIKDEHKAEENSISENDLTDITNKEQVRYYGSANELAQLLDGYQKSPGQYMALCPAHSDHNPSLSIKQGNNGKVLLHCFAGCSYKQIKNAIKQKGYYAQQDQLSNISDLPDGILQMYKGKYYEAMWTYRKKNGEIYGYVVRYGSTTDKKDIIPYFNYETDKWKNGMPKKMNECRPLYNLDQISQADENNTIWIVEGEKAADALINIGILATTSLGGCNNVDKTDWSPLANFSVIIWPDKDDNGWLYAKKVFENLLNINNDENNIEIVDIENMDIKEKEDVYDWIAKGNDYADIQKISTKPSSYINSSKVIEIEKGNLWKAMDQTEDLLLQITPYEIFQYNQSLVRIASDYSSQTNDHHVHIKRLNPHYFADFLERRFTYVQKSPNGEQVVIDPPSEMIKRYLNKTGDWKLPHLTGIIYAPTISRNGEILEEPGYDHETGIYLDSSLYNMGPIQKEPTWDDARQALKILRYPLQDFPFVSEADESVALAAILTSLVRKSIKNAPLFGFNAPVQSSGKTLLSNIISIIATGKNAAATTLGKDRQEEHKKLFAKLNEGNPVVLLDNITHSLESETLCTILTSGGNYSDRILGESEMRSVDTSVTFLANGNNLTFQGDMPRRALLCTIDPDNEYPESRDDFSIQEPLEEHIKENRCVYVNAALTILNAYLHAGSPTQNISAFGSFEEWSNWIRSSLVWLGLADPNKTRENIDKNDPTQLNLYKMIDLWEEIFGTNVSVSVADIIETCESRIESKPSKTNEHLLYQNLLELTKEKGQYLSNGKVGNVLRNHKDKIINGYKIQRAQNSAKNRANWILVKCNGSSAKFV